MPHPHPSDLHGTYGEGSLDTDVILCERTKGTSLTHSTSCGRMDVARCQHAVAGISSANYEAVCLRQANRKADIV